MIVIGDAAQDADAPGQARQRTADAMDAVPDDLIPAAGPGLLGAGARQPCFQDARPAVSARFRSWSRPRAEAGQWCRRGLPQAKAVARRPSIPARNRRCRTTKTRRHKSTESREMRHEARCQPPGPPGSWTGKPPRVGPLFADADGTRCMLGGPGWGDGGGCGAGLRVAAGKDMRLAAGRVAPRVAGPAVWAARDALGGRRADRRERPNRAR